MNAVQLADVCVINPRYKVTAASPAIVSFLGMADVSEDGHTTAGQTRNITEVAKGYKAFRAGDVLVAKITPCFENGKIARAEIETELGFGSTEFHVLRVDDESLDPRYLLHYLRQPWIRTAGERRMTGSAGQRRVPMNFLERLQIPLPSLLEQRRIAAILDYAHELRAKRSRSLVLLDELTRSIFMDMFSDDFGAHRSHTTLGSHLDFLTRGSRGWAKYYTDGGAPFLRIQNVGHNELLLGDLASVDPPPSAEARRTQVQLGDVLLSITADLGRSAVVTDAVAGGYINQHLAILRSAAFVPEFLAQLIASPLIQRQIQSKSRGGTKAGLNFDDVRSIVVPTPPLTRQAQFRDRAAAVAHAARSARQFVTSAECLQHALQTRAFRGEL